MKRVIYASLLAAVALTGVSCAAQRYVAAEVAPGSISIMDVARFETFTDISVIERGNKMNYSDSLSHVARENLDQVMPAMHRIELENPALRLVVDQETTYMLETAAKNKAKLKNVALLPMLDSMVTASGKRYGLITVHSGFTRIKGNYGKQVAKDIGIAVLTGVLTMGAMSVTPVSYKANSTLHAFIIDSESDKIVFYNTVTTEAEPCDRKVLNKQVGKLFRRISPDFTGTIK